MSRLRIEAVFQDGGGVNGSMEKASDGSSSYQPEKRTTTRRGRPDDHEDESEWDNAKHIQTLGAPFLPLRQTFLGGC